MLPPRPLRGIQRDQDSKSVQDELRLSSVTEVTGQGMRGTTSTRQNDDISDLNESEVNSTTSSEEEDGSAETHEKPQKDPNEDADKKLAFARALFRDGDHVMAQ